MAIRVQCEVVGTYEGFKPGGEFTKDGELIKYGGKLQFLIRDAQGGSADFLEVKEAVWNRVGLGAISLGDQVRLTGTIDLASKRPWFALEGAEAA